MSFTAWRIAKLRYTKSAFDGEGAQRYGGRWNSRGTSMVYTSQSQSLAVLEMLVHLVQPDLLGKYVLVPVEIPETVVDALEVSQLPKSWRAYPAPLSLKKIGDDWIRSGSSVALKVPSALLPLERNFLLNPNHPDFNHLVIGEPVRFRFDPRLAK